MYNRVLSLLPLEDELERMKSPPVSSVVHHNDMSSNPYAVVPGNSYDDYFHEAQERFNHALLAKNFWQTPYPPVKARKSLDDRRQSIRPKEVSTESADTDQTSITPKKQEVYEGLFLSRIFDQFQKLLELPTEQNLLVTSILQKIAGIVDKRTDGIICDWRAVRVGVDGTLYGGVWALPTGKSIRRSLYALLEQVTFEALKRAQLVPNFETRISIAKSKGVLAGVVNTAHLQQSVSATTDIRRSQSRRDQFNYAHSGIARPNGSISRNQPNLSKLVFNKGSSSTLVPASPRSSSSTPTTTKSAGLLPLKTKDLGTAGGIQSPTGPSSPSSAFFQNSQRSNSTPVTVTNPFAKLSNFVNAYIILQEFCKELAAVVLVRHATNYNEIGFVKYQEQREMTMIDPIQGVPNQSMNGHLQEWLADEMIENEDEEFSYKQRNLDKWKNRISVVSTMTDWRSVRSLDIIDEAITVRVPSRTTGSMEAIKS